MSVEWGNAILDACVPVFDACVGASDSSVRALDSSPMFGSGTSSRVGLIIGLAFIGDSANLGFGFPQFI